ncbi:hypothetical protein [Geothermobacter hydrogeniphilus]|uniref:Uncharacterized protein n=1 Tax=Geothermobacter hydrogeniphilus TaxID=1969733 RepID=A0A1X0YBM6_9BACT|nr:hypothetical protein [Geothermobacter hydrogeniphilus]ORJ62512.1 hypothetical protein B5V00_04300 [Geothermobacter hydrogeniphilus]
MKTIAIATLITAALPAAAMAAEPTAFNFGEMAFFVVLNGLLGLGVFAVGIILAGLIVDRFRPWIDVRRQSSHPTRKPQPHTHHFPPANLDDAISRERQDAY